MAEDQGPPSFHIGTAVTPEEVEELFRSLVTQRLALDATQPLGVSLVLTPEAAAAVMLNALHTVCQLLDWFSLHFTEEHGAAVSSPELWQMLLLKKELNNGA
jgi:hypothetical protein